MYFHQKQGESYILSTISVQSSSRGEYVPMAEHSSCSSDAVELPPPLPMLMVIWLLETIADGVCREETSVGKNWIVTIPLMEVQKHITWLSMLESRINLW
jgi:hypothetical protein